MAAPLTDLTKGGKAVMVSWNPEAERAFQELKVALCNQPVLITPDFKKEFVVQTDASDVGLGAVLSQEERNRRGTPGNILAGSSHLRRETTV